MGCVLELDSHQEWKRYNKHNEERTGCGNLFRNRVRHRVQRNSWFPILFHNLDK